METRSLRSLPAAIFVGILLFLFSLHSTSAQQTEGASEQFRLISGNGNFRLEIESGKKTVRIPVERTWLVPRGEEKENEGNYVSAFKYNRGVGAFAIGNGEIGLHLSSYEIQAEGSAAAAAGKDVFLIYKPGAARVAAGLTGLGITKDRFRSGGCFRAANSMFIIADVNGDGLKDIGVIQESISCAARPENPDLYLPPQYEQKPVKWYLYTRKSWMYGKSYDGKWVAQFAELPLIGMDKGPVDVVAYVLWGTYDSSRWKTRDGKPPAYLPGYRKNPAEPK